MKIEISSINKILIFISLFLYLIGFIFGGSNIIFDLFILMMTISLLKKSYDKKIFQTKYLIFILFFIILNHLIKIGLLIN